MKTFTIDAVVEFDREFQIWAYTVSHHDLLLRSNKSQGIPTRVDVLFKDVGWLQLPTLISRLTVRKANQDSLRSLNIKLAESSLQDRHVYLLKGDGQDGLVTALAAFWLEDEGEYFEPNPFTVSMMLK